MTERTDSQLLSEWRDGAPGAFSVLVQRYQDALLRHARGLLGRGSSYEDVVQEVFLKLAREQVVLSPDSHDGVQGSNGGQLAAWLHTVTRNACMDIIRSEQRRKHREREVAPLEATGGGQQAIDAADTRELVERAIQRLPVDQREVLILRLFAERSYREIAEVTGRKIGTVGWLISEGLKSLSGSLSPVLQADASRAPGSARSAGSGMGVA
jgi:RNA polymerase sigma-70 factor (ECF subfamily)